MKRATLVLLLSLGALVLSGLPALSLAAAPASAPHPAAVAGQVTEHGFGGHFASPTISTPVRAVGASAARPAVHPALSAAGVTPDWKTPLFFNDINVTFSIPYVGPLPFSTEPTTNTIPEYAPGFWMNISTLDHAPLVYANVTIWGSQWPVNNTSLAISGFGWNPTTVRPMLINSTANYSASFFFDDYRYFWPGDTVSFNLTVTAIGSTPATIFSAPANGANSFPEYCYTGTCDYATWIFFVQGPWVSPDFASSVQITTSPDVLSTPAYEPNRVQTLQIQLTDIAPPGLQVGTIPDAQLYYTVVTNKSGLSFGTQYSAAFGPLNSTTVRLTQPIGPFPNQTVFFYIILWLPWEGFGAIDRLYSPTYEFNWSNAGGFPNQNRGLQANLVMTTVPQVLPPASGTIPAGQTVNVTLHEPQENVTISSAQVNFVFHDGLGMHSGVLPMQSYNPNTTYVVIPGLPPGATLTWFASAKDIFGNPVFSQNYTYRATHAPPAIFSPGRSIFFFEALDVAGTGLVAGLPFTVSNASWFESSVGTALGFGAPIVPDTNGYLTLGFGSYLVTITAYGRSWTTSVNIGNQTPFTVVFYVASGPVSESSTSALPAVPVAALIGLGAAAITLPFVTLWFGERRKRIEEEQRRITL